MIVFVEKLGFVDYFDCALFLFFLTLVSPDVEVEILSTYMKSVPAEEDGTVTQEIEDLLCE